MKRIKAIDFINHDRGGNNYILGSKGANYYVFFCESVIFRLQNEFQDNFNLVIYRNIEGIDDHYLFKWKDVKHLFKTSNKYNNFNRDGWRFRIIGNNIIVGGITENYDANNNCEVESINSFESNDYYVENLKAYIKVRQYQTKFRKDILALFNGKCALTGINDTKFLVASHIIPWADRKESRLDPANGICLYVEIDKFFDQGYFSFDDNFNIITSKQNICEELRHRLNEISKLKFKKPLLSDVDLTRMKKHLKYHRENILLI
jgi:putative restriction endonuclease